MNGFTKSTIAAFALGLGLASAPAFAQGFAGERGIGYDGRATGYNDDGTLNVFGAHVDPRGARSGGVLGGVGSVVGGVGSAVGGVVGGVTGAADDIVTGSIGGRGPGQARLGASDAYDRPASRYDGSGYGRSAY